MPYRLQQSLQQAQSALQQIQQIAHQLESQEQQNAQNFSQFHNKDNFNPAEANFPISLPSNKTRHNNYIKLNTLARQLQQTMSSHPPPANGEFFLHSQPYGSSQSGFHPNPLWILPTTSRIHYPASIRIALHNTDQQQPIFTTIRNGYQSSQQYGSGSQSFQQQGLGQTHKK